MTIAKPTLPASVYDALAVADSPLVSQYNRATEVEPPAAVAVVVNVNLTWDMSTTRLLPVDVNGKYVSGYRETITNAPDVKHIAAVTEQVREAITASMRGES